MLRCVFLFIVSGLLVGFVFSHAITDGFFVQWHVLPATTFANPHLANVNGQTLYVRFSTATTYTCLANTSPCWIQQAVPSVPQSDPTTLFHDCQFSLAMTSITARPPQIEECFSGIRHYPDGSIRFAYVLDPQGQIWEWSHISTAGLEMNLPWIFSLIGSGIGGLSAALSLSWLRKARRLSP